MRRYKIMVMTAAMFVVVCLSGCSVQEEEMVVDTLVPFSETGVHEDATEPEHAQYDTPEPDFELPQTDITVTEQADVRESYEPDTGAHETDTGTHETDIEAYAADTETYEPDMEVMTESSEDVLVEIPLVTVTGIEPVTLYATTSLNVRSEPHASGNKMGTLQGGEAVTADGLADNGWYRISYGEMEAYVSGKYLSKEEIMTEQAPQPFTTGLVEVLGNVDAVWVEKADRQLAKLPQNARDRFVAAGYHFYVTDEDIGTTEFGGSIGRTAGATRYREYIKVEDRQYAIDEAVLHEFGHFVYDTCGNWTRQDVADAFGADVGNAAAMGITYGLNDASEFYAEVFQKYIKSPGSTSQAFPNLTAVIQGDLDSL